MKKIFTTIIILVCLLSILGCEKESAQDRLLKYYRLINAKKGIYIENLKDFTAIKNNEDVKFYLGSMVRLPVLVSLYYLAGKNIVSLQRKYPVGPFDYVYGPGIIQHNEEARYYSLRELARIMMYSNDVTATDMVINAVGIDNIKKALEEMKISDISITMDNNSIVKRLFELEGDQYKLFRPFQIRAEAIKKGVEISSMDRNNVIKALTNTNEATPKALALLLKKLINKELMHEELTKEVLNILSNINTEKLISTQMPADSIVYSASGTMAFEMSDASIVSDKKANFIFILLTNFIRDPKPITMRRFWFISKLAYNNYSGITEE